MSSVVWHIATRPEAGISQNDAGSPAAASTSPLTAISSSGSQILNGADHLGALRALLDDDDDDRVPLRIFAQRKTKKASPSLELTTAELEQRALAVEETANQRLNDLASRLKLSEEQQDRIFPILARSAPGFHPVLQPETLPSLRISSPVGGNNTFGDITSIEPGAPMTQIEEEIFADLDQVQQAELEEAAIDREAWWEDIVAVLEEDLEDSTSTTVLAGSEESGPTATITDEERAAAAATNEVDDFSNLLFGN